MPTDRTFHDEDTLFKVNNVLTRHVPPTKAQQIVVELLNAGILFRERVPDEGSAGTGAPSPPEGDRLRQQNHELRNYIDRLRADLDAAKAEVKFWNRHWQIALEHGPEKYRELTESAFAAEARIKELEEQLRDRG